MPFFTKKSIESHSRIAIWKIEEPLEYFSEKVTLTQEEKNQIKDLSQKKLLEWFASRYLIKLIFGKDKKLSCLKDKHGKPYLKESKDFISLSHSNDMTAIIASNKLAGIDIQNIVDKIDRISSKFVNDEEQKIIDYRHKTEIMHVLWGAKECMYKAYGQRSLDFKKNMRVSSFEYDPEGFEFGGQLVKEDLQMDFKFWAEKLDKYILVYAIEQ